MPLNSRIYLLAGLASLVLYAVGVFTGAFIYEFTQSKTSQEFADLRQEINNYGEDIGSIELELLYLSSGQNELGCKFIVTSLNSVQSDLDYFWRNLPNKLEVYERENPTDESYESLKRDYMEISLKAWLISLSVKERCGDDSVPILYFYSRDCEDCIEQGNILDRLRESHNVLVYTIDLNLDSDALDIVREAYSIEETPSLIVFDESYSGLATYSRLVHIIEGGGA
jgi:hypothetical protein